MSLHLLLRSWTEKLPLMSPLPMLLNSMTGNCCGMDLKGVSPRCSWIQELGIPLFFSFFFSWVEIFEPFVSSLAARLQNCCSHMVQRDVTYPVYYLAELSFCCIHKHTPFQGFAFQHYPPTYPKTNARSKAPAKYYRVNTKYLLQFIFYGGECIFQSLL